MSINSKISELIKYGLSPSFVMNLNESAIEYMHKKLPKKKKSEPKEAVTTKITTEKIVTMTQADAKAQGVNVDGVNVSMDKTGNINIKQTKPMTETDNPEKVDEKFESKKQQKYFYARCGDDSLSKKERNKWCKMAKEFASKTDFKKLPEKADEMDEKELTKLEESLSSIVETTIYPKITKKQLMSVIHKL
jgi:hypothetical protein